MRSEEKKREWEKITTFPKDQQKSADQDQQKNQYSRHKVCRSLLLLFLMCLEGNILVWCAYTATASQPMQHASSLWCTTQGHMGVLVWKRMAKRIEWKYTRG